MSRRILALNPTSMTSGAERVLLDYLGHLQTAGWDVTCASPDGPLHEALDAAGLRWSELPDLKLPSGNKAVGAATMAASWGRAARRIRALANGSDGADGGNATNRADVVLTNGLMALPALRLARLPMPVTWLVHDVVVRRDLQMLVRASAGAVDEAIAVSECSAAFPREAGIETSVVLNGTTWPVDRAPLDMPTPPVVGVTGVLTPWKGHQVFLDAAASIDPPVRFEIMGGMPPKDADHVAALKARAAQPDLDGRVDFLGHVTDPLARIRTWSVAVSPSIDPEACPLNVLEAMSVGVPMVVTDHGGAAELIGDAGLRVTPRSASALADGIRTLLDDQQLHATMRRRGPEIVESHHQIADVSLRFEEVLTEAIDRRSRRGGSRQDSRR